MSGPTPTRTASGSGTGVLQPPPTNIGPQPKPKPEPTGDHPAFQVPVQIKDGGVVAGKVTYRYPIEWSRLHLRNLRVPGGGQQQWVSVVGFTRRNFVAVSGYRSAPQLSKRRVQRDGADEVAAAIADSDGEVIEDRAPTEVSGLRGYTFTVSRPQSDSQIEDEVTVLFGPRAHYVIDCEMTELTRVPVRVGCAKVLRTFSAPT